MARSFLHVVVIMLASSTVGSAQSLVHLWAFEGNYDDTSGSGNHGAPTGAPTFVAGKFGQGVSLASASFDGVDLHFGANNLPLSGTDSWSMNLWAKFNEAPGQLEYLAGFGIDDGYIAADASATRAIIAFGGATNNNFYFWGGSNDHNSGAPYDADNQWHMYTVTYNGAVLSMYKDGSLVGAPVAKAFADAFDEIHVGNPSNWNNDFDGELDEFAIFSGALTESQIGGLFFNNNINQPVNLDPSITVNRDTGQILFTNDSSFPIEVLGYTIRSASGSLAPTEWLTIADRYDAPPGDGSIDNDPWTVITNESLPFSVELSEGVPGTDGGTIAVGKVINFGNAWVKNPVEDVVIDLLLDDGMGTIKSLAATFIGNGDAPHILADYNGNGVVDAADWTTFRTANRADLTGATATEAYYGGDLDGDFDKDIYDYSLFVRRYELFNGAGSFATLNAASVPEPATFALAATLLAAVGAIRLRRRCVGLMLVLAGLVISASPASAVLWGYYSLNGDANDSSGNNINLNLIGDASFAGSVHPGLGSSILLDGAGDGAIGSNFNKFTTNDATVVAWVYANNLNNAWDSIVKNWGASAVGQFHFGLDGGADNTLQNYLGDNSNVTAADPLPTGEWVHTAFVADSAALEHRIYMNGNLVATAPYAGTLVPGGATGLGIGVKPNDDGTSDVSNAPGYWNGRIDDVALFNEVKSAAEIMAIYQNGLQGIQVDGTTVPYISLQVDRATGMATLMNASGGSVELGAYQISSPEGDLRVAQWQDLAGNTGFPTGNGSGNGWEKDGGSGPTQLLETYLTGSSLFTNGTNISLGAIFTPGGDESLTFSYRLGNGAVIDSIVSYVGAGPDTLLGDFNNDGSVDAADYLVWRNNLNGPDGVLNGNGDNTGASMGVVDGADYLAWKGNFGAKATGALGVATTAVPEPVTSWLVMFALGGALVAISRQGSRAFK